MTFSSNKRKTGINPNLAKMDGNLGNNKTNMYISIFCFMFKVNYVFNNYFIIERSFH